MPGEFIHQVSTVAVRPTIEDVVEFVGRDRDVRTQMSGPLSPVRNRLDEDQRIISTKYISLDNGE